MKSISFSTWILIFLVYIKNGSAENCYCGESESFPGLRCSYSSKSLQAIIQNTVDLIMCKFYRMSNKTHVYIYDKRSLSHLAPWGLYNIHNVTSLQLDLNFPYINSHSFAGLINLETLIIGSSSTARVLPCSFLPLISLQLLKINCNLGIQKILVLPGKLKFLSLSDCSKTQVYCTKCKQSPWSYGHVYIMRFRHNSQAENPSHYTIKTSECDDAVCSDEDMCLYNPQVKAIYNLYSKNDFRFVDENYLLSMKSTEPALSNMSAYSISTKQTRSTTRPRLPIDRHFTDTNFTKQPNIHAPPMRNISEEFMSKTEFHRIVIIASSSLAGLIVVAAIIVGVTCLVTKLRRKYSPCTVHYGETTQPITIEQILQNNGRIR